jgi:hypothetical protein
MKWHAAYEYLHFALGARICDQRDILHGSFYTGRVAGWIIHILCPFSGGLTQPYTLSRFNFISACAMGGSCIVITNDHNALTAERL